MEQLNRRKFMSKLGCGAMGMTTLYSSLINLKAIGAAAGLFSGPEEDYKALVCVLLSGGNDSYNMLVPMASDEYKDYSVTRSNLALAREGLLTLNVQNAGGRSYGLHPSMGRVRGLFNDRKLAFIANIGTLVQPTTKADWEKNDFDLPLGLFSHSDQMQQWQTAFPHERSAVGWGGRIADMVKSVNKDNGISMNISLAGTNVFQSGKTTIEYAIDPNNGSEGIYGYGVTDQWDVINRMRTAAIDSLVEHQYQNIFQQTYVDVIRVSRDASILFNEALSHVGEFKTTFTDNYLSNSFQMIARVIAARKELGMKRQIFLVDFGGWDHHDEVLANQQDMLGTVSNAWGEFADVLKEINMTDNVVTFSVSEFGRTLTSNGNGTDHAWGGNVMTMGGPVAGGKIYGKYPSLALENSLELGNGVLIPTTSVDQYFSELAMWFGVNKSSLKDIFPNLSNFYNLNSTSKPIGFLNF